MNRKIIQTSVIVTFLFALTMLIPAQVRCQCIEDDTGNLDIVGLTDVCAGEAADVTVRIRNAPNAVDAIGFEVTYDTSELTYVSYNRGPCVSSWTFFDCTNPSPGVVRCGGFTLTPPIATGSSCDVVVLHFSNTLAQGECTQPDLQAQVDDVAGWTSSHGCACCPQGCIPVPEICDDDIDNDCDDLIDCADSDCATNPVCQTSCIEDDTGNLDIVGLTDVCAGEAADVTVRIRNAPNAVDAIGFEVTYDASELTYVNYNRGSGVQNWTFFDCTNPSPGVVRCGGFTLTPPIAAGSSCDVAVLHFENTLAPGQCVDPPLDLRAQVDDVAGWPSSHGCVCCIGGGNCDCDDSGQLDVKDADGNVSRTHWVRVQDAPNGVVSFGFDICYPEEILSYAGYDRGSCVTGFDFFNCTNPSPGVVRCGGFTTRNGIPAGATCDVVGLRFGVDNPDVPGKVEMCELYDQMVGWTTSCGNTGCGCYCDINGDGIITPIDALCAFETFLGICPTTFCGPCEDICCDVAGGLGTEPPDDQCTPFDALCRFNEFLEIRPNCCTD